MEVVAQERSRGVDVLRCEVVAQVGQGCVLQHLVGTGHGRRGRHDDAVEVAHTHRFVVSSPIHGVVGLLELFARHGVVACGHVAQRDVRPLAACQLGLHAHHALGSLGELLLGHAGQAEHLLQVLLVCLADRGVLLIEVVVARAHAQTALRDVERVHVAVHQVGLHAHAEERIGDRAVELADDLGEAPAVGDGEDLVQRGTDRSGALGVQTRRVEAQAVEVGDLLLDAALGGLAVKHLREELVDADLVVFAQHVERAVAREFGFQRVFLLPAARGVLVEIDFGCGRGIEVREVDRRHAGRLILTTCHDCDSCEQKDFFHKVIASY